MRLLHYIEIENFKSFGERQRIALDHPAVLIGPNNCGKTSAIQALALWSQAVKTWYDLRKASSAKERHAAPLNRLNIVAVPVQRIRFFWHNTVVRADRDEHRVARAQCQRPCHVGTGTGATALDDVAQGWAFTAPGAAVGNQLEKSELHLCFSMGGNKSALALASQ